MRFIFLLSFIFFMTNSLANTGTLTEQLETRRKASAGKRTKEIKKIMNDGNQEVKNKGLHKKKPNVGDTFPVFDLVEKKKRKSISDYWSEGYAVVKFYRGHWCPYCQIELKAYQKEIKTFDKLGAKIVVLTPDTLRYIHKTKKRFNLSFDIYQDENNMIGKKLGVVFNLNDKVSDLYKKFKIDLKDSQGNSENQLPLPATYVVNKEGKVIYKFAEADYTLRADPLEVIEAIKKDKK